MFDTTWYLQLFMQQANAAKALMHPNPSCHLCMAGQHALCCCGLAMDDFASFGYVLCKKWDICQCNAACNSDALDRMREAKSQKCIWRMSNVSDSTGSFLRVVACQPPQELQETSCLDCPPPCLRKCHGYLRNLTPCNENSKTSNGC